MTGVLRHRGAVLAVIHLLILIDARIGDLAGRRRTFMAGIALFAIASLAVGLARSPTWMITARAVQGIGAALLAPSTLALLSTSFPEGPQRARAIAAYGALAGIGSAFGLIVGGALTTTLSWRYGFFLNVPVGLAAIPAAPKVVPETAATRRSARRGRGAELDHRGQRSCLRDRPFC